MCGICGIIRKRPLEEKDVAAVRRMNAALVHRGPDGSGEYLDSQVMLAMRRLSIIDPEGSAQPLWNEDRTIALVVNGEIYNYKELRQELAGKGHTFATAGDCETIVHVYEDLGLECVHRLRGMFAFALWDAGKRRLFLARDRLGEKPLYLFETSDGLMFASELRALLQSGFVRFEMDPVSVDRYFHYMGIPEPATPIAGVRKLDAGNILAVDLARWTTGEKKYWDIEETPPLSGDPAALIREELERISEITIRSDVPVGVALSGGLDSSVVAAFAARKSPGSIHAFSVGYPGRPHNDERAAARQLADSFEMPFHDIELDTTSMADTFPDLVCMRDDPIPDISGFGYYAVSRLAREHGVPVLLQGQGGDELFWGYPWLREAAREVRLQKKRSKRGMLALPAYLRPGRLAGWHPWQLRLWMKSWFGMKAGWEKYRYHGTLPQGQMVVYQRIPTFAEAVRDTPSMYTQGFKDKLGGHRASEVFRYPELPGAVDLRLMAIIMATYMREDGIAQGDRLSMASSVEMRLPLVDYRLVEIAAGLARTYESSRLPPKLWLKQAVADILPRELLDRPKRGFEPPAEEWYKALFSRYGEQLRDGCLTAEGILTSASSEYLSKGVLPHGDLSAPLCFKALVLEHWCRKAKSCCAGST